MNKEPETNKKRMPQFIGIGLVLGIAVGVAIDNIGLGIALGLVFGAGIGAARDRQQGMRNGKGEDSEISDESS